MAADLYPTIKELLGVTAMDPAVTYNGVSLVPLLTGQAFARVAGSGPGWKVYGSSSTPGSPAYVYTETYSVNYPVNGQTPWSIPTPGTRWHRAGTDGTFKVIKELLRDGSGWGTAATRYLQLVPLETGQIQEVTVEPNATHVSIEAMINGICTP